MFSELVFNSYDRISEYRFSENFYNARGCTLLNLVRQSKIKARFNEIFLYCCLIPMA